MLYYDFSTEEMETDLTPLLITTLIFLLILTIILLVFSISDYQQLTKAIEMSKSSEKQQREEEDDRE